MTLHPAPEGMIVLGRYGVKVEVNLILEQATKTQIRSISIALLIL